jgi:hypothetical protein
MELMMLLRLLWRRRILVGVGAVVSVAVAVAMGHGSTPASGLAKTGVVIDTPSSQLVADLPANAATLPWRATVMGILLGTPGQRAQVARDAGIPVAQLAVVDTELLAPTIPASLPRAAAEAAAGTTEQYVLTAHTDNALPIVWIEAAGPSTAAAARLANAAVHTLQAGASPHSTDELQGLSIRPLGALHVRAIPGGPGHKKLVALAAIVFLLWVVGLTVGPLVRGIGRTLSADRALGV